jgi:hypothetical protein
MKHVDYKGYRISAEPNEDREGENVYIECPNGDFASLACAENEGETADGTFIPKSVVDKAHDFIYVNDINY